MSASASEPARDPPTPPAPQRRVGDTGCWGRAALAGTLLVGVVACLVLIGWSFGYEPLKRLSPTPTTMNPLTALSFLLAAMALFTLRDGPPRGMALTAKTMAGTLLVLAGGSKLVDLWLGTDFCPDDVLFGQQVLAQQPIPSRIAPNTALCLALFGSALLMVDLPRRGWVVAQALTLPILLLSVLAILGYAYDTTGFYRLKTYIPMAFTTAVNFLLAVGALLLYRRQGVMRMLTDDSRAARLTRVLLPACVLVPALLGGVAVWGQKRDYYSLVTGISLLVLVIMLALGAIAVWVAYRLARYERDLMAQNRALGDVTTRARAALAKAERSEQRYKALTELNPQKLWTADAKGRVDYVNQEFLRYFGDGFDPKDAAAWLRITHPDDLEVFNRLRRQSIEAGAPLEAETRLLSHDGTWRSHMVRAVPVAKDEQGRPTKWFGINFDVEELRQARETAEQASRMKSSFLSSMSHEIRTPMNAVIGFSGLLADTSLNQQQQQFVDAIRTSGDHLLDLINNILDFSKIEAGQLQLEKRPFSLRHLVESALDIVAPAASEKGLELAAIVADDAPSGLVADESRLRQVLVNLLANAVKFSREGEVVVEVEARLAPGDDPAAHEFHFRVRDQGIGLSPEHMPRLFKEFSQADVSTSRRYGGTGLGLAICKRLVEMHGGRIWAESVEGQGSTFHFLVPAPAHAAPVLPPSTSLRGRHLLVVDDNAVNLEILRRQAVSWGMEVFTTQDPEEAGLLVRAGQHFDLAVLDHMMPGIDGPTLAQRLRGLPETKALPLVLLSSLGMPVPGGLFNLNLTKPIKQSALHDALVLAIAGGGDGRVASLAEPALAAPRSTERPPAPPAALAILLVEDNPMNQQLAVLLLQKLGYRADVAGNGLEALAALEKRHYDLVLMDVEMPEMDGLTAAQEINRIYGERRPRLVALTAQALAGDRERCLAAGMDDYLSKPLRLADLATALGRAPAAPRIAEPEPGLGAADGDFDEASLRALVDNYELEGATAIVGALARQLPADREALRGGLAAGDLDVLRRLAHTWKSCARTVGAEALGAACEEMESAAQSGRLAAAAEPAPALLGRFVALLPRIEAFLAALRSAGGDAPDEGENAVAVEAAPKVLVVDDAASGRIMLRYLLTTLGAQVVEAASGPQALKACQDHDFALVLLDVVMPGMDGFALASEIAKRAADRVPPIIFVTGSLRDAQGRAEAYKHGAVDAIAKPINEIELLSKAKVFLDLHRDRRRLQQEVVRRARQESEARETALHDPLTGLPNRLLFRDRLSHAIDVAQRRSTSFALLFVDLDRFKPVNDRLGHDAGDQVLKSVAARLRENGRKVDTAARLGGDEFAVLVDEPMPVAAAQRFAQRLCRRLQAPHEIEVAGRTQAVEVGASIGVAVFPDHAHTLELLLQMADSAMYRAKQAGDHEARIADPALDVAPDGSRSARNPV